jgi:hypothetical protein
MNVMKEMAKVQAEIDANWRKIHHIINKAKMENKNFYPLRIGKYASCIVSDMPVTHRNKKEMDSEHEHYGGFVIAESIPAEIAKEFVDLFNKKYGCPAGIEQKACTGGQMCCQSKISHHEWVEQENKLHATTVEDMSGEKLGSNPFINDLELDNAKANSKATIEERFAACSLDLQISFIKNQYYGANGRMYKAIIHNLESIKRWNETPVYNGDIDVAKVLSGLVKVLRGHDDAEDQEIAWHIKKGETAIDMINRFKEEREAGMAPREGYVTSKHKNVITANDVAEAHHAGVDILNRKATRQYIPQSERDELVNDIIEMLPFSRNIARKTANTIVTAIESMDTLKHKHGR